MKIGSMLLRILAGVMIVAAGATATLGQEDTHGNVLTAYIVDGDGIPLFVKDDGNVEQHGHFDLAGLVMDMAKTGGDASMAAQCMNAEQDMPDCIDDELQKNKTKQRNHEVRKKRLNHGLKRAQRHGMHVNTIPFVQHLT